MLTSKNGISRYLEKLGIEWNNDPFPMLHELDQFPMVSVGECVVQWLCVELLNDINMKNL